MNPLDPESLDQSASNDAAPPAWTPPELQKLPVADTANTGNSVTVDGPTVS
jgi:hypothetical protein